MIIHHHGPWLPNDADWHTVIDDFGNMLWPFKTFTRESNRAWAAAYRFANGQTFEQAGMRTIGAVVEEH